MRVSSAVTLGLVSLATLAGADAQIVRRSQPALPSGTATLTGTVLTENNSPVSGALVTLTALGFQAKETESDEQGRFTFANVPEESVELHASAANFLEAVYGEARPGSPATPIRLRAGERFDVVIHVFRGSVIAGSVVNDDGRPVAGIKVWASRLRPLSDGEQLQVPIRSAETDDRGNYRINGLPPGRYIVFGYRSESVGEIHRTSASGQDEIVKEAGLYYPDATGPDEAERFALEIGEERLGLDLHLHLVPVTHIAGVVRFANGQPCPNAWVRLLPANHVVVEDSTTNVAGTDGRFELTGVAAGDYEIVVNSNVSGTQGRIEPLWAFMAISSDGRTPADIRLVLEPGSTVSGTVAFDDRSTSRPPAAGIQLWLENVSGSMTFGVPSAFSIDADGRFAFKGVPRGRFMIGVQRESAPAGWTIKSELLNGRDILDFPFDIDSHEAVDGIAITFTDHPTELSGTVVGADGKPSAEHTVVVFATDERFWTPRSRRIEQARPDVNGQFSFRGLPTGEYVVAVADADLFGRPDSLALQTLKSVSARVTLQDGEKKIQNLRAREGTKSPAK
jgi:Carboxypeptidase regulatory-like domain